MEMACAECGCRVDAGVRLATCGNSSCCCRDLPTGEALNPVTGDASRGDSSAPSRAHESGEPDMAAAPGVSKALDRTFKIGMVLKGADGVLEIAGGILLLFLTPASIQHFTRTITAHELSQDPHDLIANHLLHSANHLTSGSTLFGAIYLLSHGVSKVVLVVLVLRDKLWAYPWMIALLLAFIAYQLYRITLVHFSAGLAALTVFDTFLVWLTWREYRAKRGAGPTVAAVGV
jgi:uncharacterized membrane protein